MRLLILALPLLALAAPATAQIPISGVGTLGGGREPYGGVLRQFGYSGHYTDTPPARYWREGQYTSRDVEMAGQLGRLERRIHDMRENGELSRREYRSLRREIRSAGSLYFSASRNGFSDSAASLVQTHIESIASRTSTPRAGR